MGDAFDGILGQPQVREFLRASVKTDHVTHAYLFTGPAGSNKTQAAYAFAQALLCPKGAAGPRGGACGACDRCTRVRRRTHPDIHFFQPEGSGGYLVEQIREVVTDVSFAPIQADKKIYILDRVDQLGISAANAFLKTLEEPPDNVVLILLGRTKESVLPTIVSRCQIVPFRHIPPDEAAGIVSQNTGADLARSRIAMEACAGSMSRAIAFLRASGNERLHFRSELMRTLAAMGRYDDWEVLKEAKRFVELSKAPLDEVRVKQEEDLAQHADFLAKSAVRQIEARNKRQITAKTAEYLKQAFAIMESWLRDVGMVCAGSPELIINVDMADEIRAVAATAELAQVFYALAKIEEACCSLDYNVSPETCLDVAFLTVREVQSGAHCSSKPSI